MRPPTDPCGPFVLHMMDELSISAELIATQGDAQDRIRVITPTGEWMVSLPTNNEWLRGHVLMALKPFILTEQAVGLVVTTHGTDRYESWVLAKGGAKGIRHVCERADAFKVTAVEEASRNDAPALTARFGWFCIPNASHEVTGICLLRLDETLGPNGLWPALPISTRCSASEQLVACA